MENKGSNRWLIGVIVILVVALIGAVCVSAGALLFLSQQPATSQNTNPVPGAQPAAPGRTAVVPTRAPASAAGKNTLRIPGAEPPTLDPALTGDASSAEYVVEIFSGLVYLDRNLKVAPDLAETWKVSDDGKTYTFTIRKNATFHDGRPVTAQDFKYSLERTTNPVIASPTAETYLGDIVGVKEKLNRKAQDVSGIKVVDDYTLAITIDAPKAYFLAKLTFPTAYVVDKNNVERGGRTWTDKPNGTGPYKLQEYARSQRILLTKNDSFYLDPKPQVQTVEYILGGGSAMTMYENGDLEAVPIGISDIERVSDTNSPLNKELSINPQLSTGFLVFNVRKPPFDDPKVRQAFALAIDRQKLVDVVYRKMASPASTILPPGMPGYTEPKGATAFDPAKAKQLLSESKYAGKLPEIVWTTSGGGGSTPQGVQAMTAMLKENLGISVSIEQTDWATFINQLNDPAKNPYQVFDIAWIADYADPQNFLDILFRSNSIQNWAAYGNPEVDKVLDQAALEKDAAARFKLYEQAEQLILADYPIVPLTYSRDYWLTKPYVKDMLYPPLIIPRLRYVSLTK
ncbi:MAG: peptide ABC transporter substrate-binding protein [Chloroflexi bacterium]|nr:peptide ABC transporter substrate-binding protein [Chloroflexota bacterium]